jgi:hypothetical protein
MYRRTKEYIKTNNAEPTIFIQGDDVQNSELLYKLDRVTEFSLYTITKYEHRIDLIARDIYSDEKYSWILLYVNRCSVDELVRGKVLKYIPQTSLKLLINSV